MIHARKEYNRIQDPENKIGEDEPVFLLRAKDKTAPQIVLIWAATQRDNPNADPKLIKMAEQHAHKMEEWQIENDCKWADL